MGEVYRVVGVSERRVDGHALVTGAPVYVGDRPLPPGTLHVALLRSPHAHARIRSIDVSEALAVPGVVLVLTHANTPPTRYTTAGQGFPEPSPYDARMFDTKVRFVGDRVAAVAAGTLDAAREAASLVRVVYELLPPVLSVDEAVAEGAAVIHDEPDSVDVWDASRNVAAHVVASSGDVDAALAASAAAVDVTCETHYAQHAPLEPHAALTYLDDDERLVIVSSTQVPFHVRRILARLLDVPVHRIRVVKPRIGGGFGAKQEVLVEDIPALVTLRTGRPAAFVYTREEETVSSRTRHPMRVRVRLGADPDGTLTAADMEVLSNTGAYGTHALTVLSNVGSKSLPLYNTAPAVRFRGDAVYTTLPVAGAYRGYGATQGQFALETAMDRLAAEIGLDPVELRRRNHIRVGGTSPVFAALGEGREGVPQVVGSCELDECIRFGAERIGWAEKRGARRREGSRALGVGMSIHMQGSGIAAVDMASASLKMNDDGSFNLLVGATDLGTGSDTVLAQIAAEILGVPLGNVLVLSSDTDLTPFDTGAYASSTTYVSGSAVERAARRVAAQIREAAAGMLGVSPDDLVLDDERVGVPDGESVTLEEVALRTLYATDQRQIAAVESFVPDASPPPFLASFAEVAVDTETGAVDVLDYVAVVDCGTAINPALAEGQVEGAIANGIGYALFEKMDFTSSGRCVSADLGRYKIASALDVPPIEVILVESSEPSGPFGAKSVAEIGINAPLPTIASAIEDAVGIRLTESPFTSEKIWRALNPGE